MALSGLKEANESHGWYNGRGPDRQGPAVQPLPVQRLHRPARFGLAAHDHEREAPGVACFPVLGDFHSSNFAQGIEQSTHLGLGRIEIQVPDKDLSHRAPSVNGPELQSSKALWDNPNKKFRMGRDLEAVKIPPEEIGDSAIMTPGRKQVAKTILPTCLLALVAGSLFAAVEEGFVPLLDGQSLNGWLLVYKKNSGRGYLVEDGKIVCPPDGGGNLLTVEEFANFVFRFEFRMEPGGNNGVGIRAPISGDIAYSGMEIQILDHEHPKYKDWLKPAQRHGSIYGVVPAKTGHLKPAGEWNEEEITANGRRITVTLNGAVIVDADLDSVKDPDILKQHPGLARTTGRIGFLGHGSRVEFRNIRIKELP